MNINCDFHQIQDKTQFLKYFSFEKMNIFSLQFFTRLKKTDPFLPDLTGG